MLPTEILKRSLVKRHSLKMGMGRIYQNLLWPVLEKNYTIYLYLVSLFVISIQSLIEDRSLKSNTPPTFRPQVRENDCQLLETTQNGTYKAKRGWVFFGKCS